MIMKIVGYEPASLIDWPGKVAAVLFAPGCNMDCWYCHNRPLLGARRCGPLNIRPRVRPLARDRLLAALTARSRRGLLDGVVVTGGEPTLQPTLAAFIVELRKRTRLPVKLDTNGTNPRGLASLLALRLVDYVALDIKAPPDRYAETAGTRVRTQRIEQSLAALRERRDEAQAGGRAFDYELRTTCVPRLGLDDIAAIGRWVRGAHRLVLQQYRPLPIEQRWLDPRHFDPPHPPGWFDAAADTLREHVGEVGVRGVTPATASATAG